jgi:hypothetical protein
MESYGQSVKRSVDEVIKKFILDLSKKYNLNKVELLNVWDNVVESNNKENNSDERNKYEKKLCKMKKTELMEMCTELELEINGNKTDLIKRILSDKFDDDNIIKNLNKSVDSIIVSRNKFGNYEHIPTGFVFNQNTKTVIGKQIDDGSVISLTKIDIESCNQHKFKYNIPTDLGGDDEVELDDEFSDEFSDNSDDEED